MWERMLAEYDEWKKQQPPPTPPPGGYHLLTDIEMDEISSRAMLEGMQAVTEQRFLETTAPAIHARVSGHSPRPRLAATNESPAITERRQRVALSRRKIIHVVGS